MVLFLFFIFFLILENLLLPAMIGFKPFPITPLFVAAMIIYGKDLKLKILQAVVFLLVGEFFMGLFFGNMSIPFLITSLVFVLFNYFFDIGSGLREGGTFFSILIGILTLLIFINIYSFIYLFLISELNFTLALENFNILFKTSIFHTLAWSAAFSFLFRFGLKLK